MDHVGAIRLISKDASLIPQQAEAVRSLIHQRHHITPPEEDDFRLITPTVIAQLVKGSAGTLSILLIALAALSLFVGGVVMMNILLISVAERTKEIGVKMAMGARRGWITAPVVLESLLYTLLGGAIGLIMAMGAVVLLDQMPTEGNDALEMIGKPTLSLHIGLAAAAILGFIGLMAGYFPARRAASINPAETLRYE